ncbi:aminopeptidase P family protein [Chitinophaga sedimenti]|uniref:aminopeptidase P family protein n=1 Tax=Chitinophaga sedimenti TaxID=2033606 RepID=UPI002005A66E|nr:aminopeptidase P family protein [Chitinophaga sedimenti]MCK7555888.1 aminopeptidase P family protein [Chitinophaga sedimenti]
MHFKLFDKAIYKQRREILRSNIGSGLVLLMGNEYSSMNYKDNVFPFRQDSTFLYYFGLDKDGLAGMIDADSGEEIIFGNELSIDDIIWTGPLPTVREMAAEVAVQKTEPYTQVANYVQQALKAGRTVHILKPYRPENKIKLAGWFGINVTEVDSKVSVKLIKAVVAQRSHKAAEEVAEIEKAVSISVDMHLAAIRQTRPGMKEFEVAAKVEEVALAANGRLAYPTILSIDGEVLHNHYHGNTIADGDMVLVDAGAENDMHYAGDLTRTFPGGKQFTSRQADVYNAVLGSMDHAISLLKPGTTYLEIHRQACIKLLEGLKDIGLVKGNPEEAVAAGAHTLFFQCGLGHMMGLDVHDMEDLGEQYLGYTDTLIKRTDFGWKSLRLGRELQEGFVLTVEPGVYIIPELIDRWKAENKLEQFINYTTLEQYRDFGGIRIEDNFLITADGHRLLGKYLPKTLKEIEALRNY